MSRTLLFFLPSRFIILLTLNNFLRLPTGVTSKDDGFSDVITDGTQRLLVLDRCAELPEYKVLRM